MKAMPFIFSSLLVVLFLTSCSSDIDDNLVTPPSDFYYPGSMPVPFYSNGSTGFPAINWGNDSGLFMLNESYTGVSINSATGVVSWNEDLPLGENLISVTATNSAGFAVTTVLFLHQFGGIFSGGYNADPNSTVVSEENLDIAFNVNGSLTLTDSGEEGSGTWSFTPQGDLICSYTIASGSYQLRYNLTYSLTVTPLLEGYKRVSGNTENLGFSRMNY